MHVCVSSWRSAEVRATSAAWPSVDEQSPVTFLAPDHPALPGHFPGAPVVPGALLLAEGLERLGSLTGQPIQCDRIESAKFFQPVAAGTSVTATLSRTEQGQTRIEFSVAGTPVAHLTVSAMRTAEARIHE
jgi:3-hydroxymyristoyl/3-hydroxydecanoyl-(acyl carrier protein) dehydratase